MKALYCECPERMSANNGRTRVRTRREIHGKTEKLFSRMGHVCLEQDAQMEQHNALPEM